MAIEVSAGVLLSPQDCASLDYVVMIGLRSVNQRDGTVPQSTLDAAALLHAMAAEFRKNALVNPGSGTVFDACGSARGSSEVTERLTVQEAARLTGTSTSYLRRLARKGDVKASRSGGRGEWVIDGGTLAAWAAGRNIKKAG
jgi:excisionase family DNA binding protein